MADIFISYSRKDALHAETLAEQLRCMGMSVWMDTAVIAAAETWSAEIVAAIKGCTAFIVLLSPDSVASHNVTKEVALASEKRKLIIPIEVRRCELNDAMEYALAGLHRMALNDREALARSLDKLGLIPTARSKENNRLRLLPIQVRLAVLPFEDLSPGKDHDWFSDGLSYELIDMLMCIHALFVVDRQTVHEYKNSKLGVREIADHLGVRYIVTGTVQKISERVRITATLIDSLSGNTLWNFKESGTMDDIFAIQEAVARKIAEGLCLTLSAAEQEMIAERATHDADAYELYLQAMYYDNRNTMQDKLHAIHLGEQAVALDPNFATAFACLGGTYLAYYRNYDRSHMWLDKAEAVISKSLELDPESSNAYSMLGSLYVFRGDPERAIASAKKAVELAPNKWVRHFQLGFVYMNLCMPREAIEAFEAAIAKNPESLVTHFDLVLMYEQQGLHEKKREAALRALPYYEKFVTRHPDELPKKMNYTVLLLLAGKIDESLTQLDELLKMPMVDSNIYFNAGCTYMSAERPDRALEMFEKAIDTGFKNIDAFRSNLKDEHFTCHQETIRRYEQLCERLEKIIEQ